MAVREYFTGSKMHTMDLLTVLTCMFIYEWLVLHVLHMYIYYICICKSYISTFKQYAYNGSVNPVKRVYILHTILYF